MTLQPCTTGGATSVLGTCTPGGATSGAGSKANLAPFFVQHQSRKLAPTGVQHTLHPRWCNIEYPYLLTHSRHALACKTDVTLYRIFATTRVDVPDHKRNNRPRAEEVSGA